MAPKVRKTNTAYAVVKPEEVLQTYLKRLDDGGLNEVSYEWNTHNWVGHLNPERNNTTT
jgi:hypothetical protein